MIRGVPPVTVWRTDADWPPDALYRLAAFARARREELGYSSQDALAPDVGSTTVHELESAKRLPRKPVTVERYERRLRWGPGSFLSILQGGASLPLAGEPVTETIDTPDLPFPALVRATGHLREDDKRRLIKLLVDQLHSAPTGRTA